MVDLVFCSSTRRHTRLQGDWSSDFFFFSSRRRHTRLQGDWSSDVCSSDLRAALAASPARWTARAARFARCGFELGQGLIEPLAGCHGRLLLAVDVPDDLLGLDRKSVV